MKPAQITVGGEYEDRGMKNTRAVVGIWKTSDGTSAVTYTEHPAGSKPKPLYWRLARPKQVSLAEFAAWAARPAGAKSPFKNWKGGPEYRFAKN